MKRSYASRGRNFAITAKKELISLIALLCLLFSTVNALAQAGGAIHLDDKLTTENSYLVDFGGPILRIPRAFLANAPEKLDPNQVHHRDYINFQITFTSGKDYRSRKFDRTKDIYFDVAAMYYVHNLKAENIWGARRDVEGSPNKPFLTRSYQGDAPTIYNSKYKGIKVAAYEKPGGNQVKYGKGTLNIAPADFGNYRWVSFDSDKFDFTGWFDSQSFNIRSLYDKRSGFVLNVQVWGDREVILKDLYDSVEAVCDSINSWIQ